MKQHKQRLAKLERDAGATEPLEIIIQYVSDWRGDRTEVVCERFVPIRRIVDPRPISKGDKT